MSLRVSCMNCTTILFSNSFIIFSVFFIVIFLKNIITNNQQQYKILLYNMTWWPDLFDSRLFLNMLRSAGFKVSCLPTLWFFKLERAFMLVVYLVSS